MATRNGVRNIFMHITWQVHQVSSLMVFVWFSAPSPHLLSAHAVRCHRQVGETVLNRPHGLGRVHARASSRFIRLFKEGVLAMQFASQVLKRPRLAVRA